MTELIGSTQTTQTPQSECGSEPTPSEPSRRKLGPASPSRPKKGVTQMAYSIQEIIEQRELFDEVYDPEDGATYQEGDARQADLYEYTLEAIASGELTNPVRAAQIATGGART